MWGILAVAGIVAFPCISQMGTHSLVSSLSLSPPLPSFLSWFEKLYMEMYVRVDM